MTAGIIQDLKWPKLSFYSEFLRRLFTRPIQCYFNDYWLESE